MTATEKQADIGEMHVRVRRQGEDEGLTMPSFRVSVTIAIIELTTTAVDYLGLHKSGPVNSSSDPASNQSLKGEGPRHYLLPLLAIDRF